MLVRRRHRDADAGADAHRVAVDLVGRVDERDDAFRELDRGAALVGLAGLNDREFVAAEPRHHVGFAQRRLQAIGGLSEQRVAGGMAERIVDVLEAVEVEHEDGERLFPPTQPRAGLLELLHEVGAVGEAGQQIVTRHERDLLLVAPAVGDVLVDGDPAAAVDRLVGDLDHPPVAQFVDGAIRLVAGDLGDAGLDIFLRGLRGTAGRDPRLEDRPQRHSRSHIVGAQPVHLGVARIADDEPLLAVEHAQAMGHVFQRHLQNAVLSREAAGLPHQQAGAEEYDQDHEQGAGPERGEVLVPGVQAVAAVVADQHDDGRYRDRLVSDDAGRLIEGAHRLVRARLGGAADVRRAASGPTDGLRASIGGSRAKTPPSRSNIATAPRGPTSSER